MTVTIFMAIVAVVCVFQYIEGRKMNKKLEDFKNERDTMEEVFENKEQIEISKYYERQPKPDLVAISEFENGELFYRKAKQED